MKKIIIDMPVGLMDAAKSPEAKDKPYNVCYSCPALEDGCDGPNCLAMLYNRWVEWINALAKRKGLTRAVIAELANLSLATVNNALSGKSQDIKLYTAAAITKAVKGGSWGKYPCHFVALLMHADFVEMDDVEQTQAALAAAQNQVKDLQEKVDGSRERRETAVTEAKEDAQKKIDFLKEQISFKERTILDSRKMMIGKDRTIKILGILIGALGAILLGLLVADAVIPGMGWFRF